MSKNPVRRARVGNPLRLPAKTKRVHFLETDVTEEEHQAVVEYCMEKKISVSEFLADLLLEDETANRGRPDPVSFKAALSFTGEQFDKLELLAHLRQKASVDELIQDLIQPHLDLQRLHAPAQTKLLRVYLSKLEHARATRHLADRGLPARKYISFLAMKKIAQGQRAKK